MWALSFTCCNFILRTDKSCQKLGKLNTNQERVCKCARRPQRRDSCLRHYLGCLRLYSHLLVWTKEKESSLNSFLTTADKYARAWEKACPKQAKKGSYSSTYTTNFLFFLFLGFVYSPFSIPFYQTQNLLRSSEKCQDGPAAAASIAVGQNLASFQDMSDFHTKICIVLVVCKWYA